MATDPAAYLAEVRGLIGARDDLITRMKVAAVPAQEFNVVQDRLAERTAPLAAALEAVLAHHNPSGLHRETVACPEHKLNSFGRPNQATFSGCPECRHVERARCWYSGCPDEWPCPTYRDLRAALLGEGDTDGNGL